jgi:amino acid transporter
VLICYGALAGALAWLLGPSRGLLATAHDGELPPFLQRTNRKGIPRNILLVQGVIVSLISGVYLTTKDVSNAFFLIAAMTVSLYIIMYLLLYGAAIRLRVTQPERRPPSLRLPVLPSTSHSSPGEPSCSPAYRCSSTTYANPAGAKPPWFSSRTKQASH